MEREEREKLDREKKEKELQERKEKDEKEKRDREEREKREREDREKKLEEREKRDREEREKKLEEERVRREKEQQEKDLKALRDKEEKEKADRLRKEEEDKRKREREEEDQRKREAAEADRKRREKEDEDRRLREKQEADKREREKQEREEKEKLERLEKQKREEEERLQKLETEKQEEQARQREKEAADRKEKERLADLEKKKKAEEEEKRKKEQEEAAKKTPPPADDGFDDFEDDFGDMDDILESIDAKKPAAKTPEPPKVPETKPPVAKPEPKKSPPADEEMEFDDFDEDGFEDLIEESMDPKKKQPAAKTEPAKPAAKTEPAAPQPPTKAGAMVPVDNILKHKKVFTSEHLPLEDQFINSIMPMSDEDVQQFLSSMDLSPQLLNMLFNEFISSKLMFMLDLEETDAFLQICHEWVQGGKLSQPNVDATAAGISDMLKQMFEEDYKDIKYFFAPFELMEEFQEESICQAILDVKNQQVLFVSLNPSITVADIRKNSFAQKLSTVFAKVVSSAMETGPGKDVLPDNIHLVELQPDLRDFLIDSCEDPSLRFAMITYLCLFENATDTHDFDGFKESLAFENYTGEHAQRFVSTIKTLGDSLKIRTELSQQPDILQGIMAIVQMNMAKHNIQVIVNTAEAITPANELQEKIEKDFEELVELKSSATKVFAVLEYCTSETQKLLYYMLLQDDEPSIVLYLDTNCEPENFKGLSVLESNLKKSGMPYTVHFEHSRHQFIQNNIDVFVYTWLIQVCETGLSGIDALRILVYNELAFVNEIMQAELEGDGEEEGGLGLEDGQEEMLVGEDDFDDDFDDLIDGQKAAPGKAPNPNDKASKPASKPAAASFDDGDQFDDIESGDLDFAPSSKKPEPKKSNKNLKPTTQPKKDNNFDYGNEFDEDFDDDIAKGGDDDFDDLDF